MTDVMKRFQAQLAGIEPEQARQMRLAWDTEDPAPRKAAWAAATAALRATGRAGELDELRDAVNAWAGDKAFNFQDLYGGGSPERTRQEARLAALPVRVLRKAQRLSRWLRSPTTREGCTHVLHQAHRPRPQG